MHKKHIGPFINISWSNATAASQALKSYRRKENAALFDQKSAHPARQVLKEKGTQQVFHVC